MSGPPAFHINAMLEKMANPDPDYRFMALSDLHETLISTNSHFNASQIEAGTMSKIVDAVIKALDDQNGEVQNLAVKW